MTTPNCPYDRKPGVRLDHLEGILPDHEEERFRTHLAGCARCAEELRVIADLLAVARSGPAPAPAPGAEARIRAAMRAGVAPEGSLAGRRGFQFPAFSWRPFALAAVSLAFMIVFLVRFASHGPLAPAPVKEPVIATAPETLDIVAPPARHDAAPPDVELAMDPRIDGEITSYEQDLMHDDGDDLALENLSADEEDAFTRLLDEELEALLAKRRSIDDQSSRSPALEGFSS